MKCTACGLMNYQGDTTCRRCQALLAAPPTTPLQYGAQIPPPHSVSPYATPPAYGVAMAGPPAGTGVWRENDSLVMFKQAQLPDRCFKCNAPAYGRRLNRQLWYIHPALYILAISPVIFLIVYMIVRKGARVDIGICETHDQRRRMLAVVGGALLILSIVAIVMAIAFETPAAFAGGLLLFLVGLVVVIVGQRFVLPSKIDNEYVWLKGMSPDYLASFPPSVRY